MERFWNFIQEKFDFTGHTKKNPHRPPPVVKKEHQIQENAITAEDFLFHCFCKLQEEFKLDLNSELESIVQNAYRMFAEYQKMKVSIDPTCQTCGHEKDVAHFDLEANSKWTKGKFEWDTKITEINRLIFNHEDFRPNQRRVINAALSGKDCLVVMPTGAGKSLLYQLPAVCSEGVTIVVSPLLSLIHDQCTKLQNVGIQANYLTSLQTPSEAEAVTKDLNTKNPELKLLYVTPERVVRSSNFMAILQALYDNHKLDRFVIDEAHCVSQWGHDFRPDYAELDVLKKNFPDVPLMALTAAATSAVKSDIMRHLGIIECEFFTQSFNRPSLRYEVRRKTRRSFEKMVKWINNMYPNQSGIIYCQHRKDCEQLSQRLKNCEISCGYYHAGMSAEDRKSVQESWSSGELSVLVATCAFGLGIDKPDVRFVIHWNMPSTLETYYQESGRAGRDGKEAHCILFYNYPDKHRIEKKNVKNSLNAYQSVKNVSEQNSRMNYVVDIFRATSNPSIKANGHENLPLYGSGKSLSESDTYNMLFEMMNKHHILSEKIVMGSYNNIFTYLRPADGADDLLAGNIKVVIRTRAEPIDRKMEKDTTESDDEHEEVEKILDKRTFKGRVQYLVKWADFGEDHNCWVDAQDMLADEMISEFENSQSLEVEGAATPRRSKRKTPTSGEKGSKRKKQNNVEGEEEVMEEEKTDSDYKEVAMAVVKMESPYKTPQKKKSPRITPEAKNSNNNNITNNENNQASPFDVFLMSPMSCTLRLKETPTDERVHHHTRTCTCKKKSDADSDVVTSRIKSEKTNIELVFSFDTTGSMSKVIEEVRSKLKEMIRRLFADIPGIRIAIIAHGDYCDESVFGYVLQKLDFSTDVNAICSFVNNVGMTGGGDWEEAYEFMLQQTKTLSWTPNYSKALVVIGDAIPHAPEDSAKGIDWRAEVSDLNKNGVKIYGVQAYPDEDAEPFFKYIANSTGGEYIPMNNFQHINEVFMGLCYMEATERNLDNRMHLYDKLKGGKTHVFLTNEMEDMEFSEAEMLEIHNAIHSNENSVKYRGSTIPISTGKSGCRMVRIQGITFVEQNKKTSSKYAKLANQGQKITWFIQNGHWGSIVDGTVDTESHKSKFNYKKK